MDMIEKRYQADLANSLAGDLVYMFQSRKDALSVDDLARHFPVHKVDPFTKLCKKLKGGRMSVAHPGKAAERNITWAELKVHLIRHYSLGDLGELLELIEFIKTIVTTAPFIDWE